MSVPQYSRHPKSVGPDKKLDLIISAPERRAIADGLASLGDHHVKAIQYALASQPVVLTRDEWSYLASKIGHLAGCAADKKMGQKLQGLYARISGSFFFEKGAALQSEPYRRRRRKLIKRPKAADIRQEDEKN
jgi:hypothetical protein